MSKSTLTEATTMSFVTSTKPEEAKKFYVETLGLTFLSEDEYGLMFSVGRSSMLRIQKMKDFTPHQSTVFGWVIDDISNAVEELTGRGVKFENFGFPAQDSRGVCTFENGDQVAWFKDLDGNTLSIAQIVIN
jgi:catechol 2,3-dioxygenase-like lactoylglutathione lyase family enzyme